MIAAHIPLLELLLASKNSPQMESPERSTTSVCDDGVKVDAAEPQISSDERVIHIVDVLDHCLES